MSRSPPGVAVVRADDDASALLRRSDAAMYGAKSRGKGRFQIATAPVA
ncbi:hypothetical protein ACNTMW_14045 [Planosporangium sp. 12N6]